MFLIFYTGLAGLTFAGNLGGKVDSDSGVDVLRSEFKLLQHALRDARKSVRQNAKASEKLKSLMLENSQLRVKLRARDEQINDLRKQIDKLETDTGVKQLKKRLHAEDDLFFLLDNNDKEKDESYEVDILLKRNQQLERQLDWLKNMRNPKMNDSAMLLRERDELLEKINNFRQINKKQMSSLNKLQAKTEVQNDVLESQAKELHLLRFENKLLQDALQKELTKPLK